MAKDLCAWPHCRNNSGMTYAALRTKAGVPVAVELCDKHWEMLAGKGPVKMAVLLREKVPGLKKVDPYYAQERVIAPPLEGETLPPEEKLFADETEEDTETSTFDGWGAGGGFDDG